MITNFGFLIVFIATSYLVACNGANNSTSPETTIPQGTVRGINMLTRNNRTVYGFLGVPYAEPPIGDLRFKAPESPRNWNGTLDASNDTEVCPQFNDDGIYSGIEDCLYLNIFTPQLPTSNATTLLPVIFYIIGGGFKTGNNSIGRYGPDWLLDKDVLLVTPNFRVGVLGFLTTGDEVAPGNYGLKDIVQALKWTQENVEYFGGDPTRVTLCGGSSGGISVHLLALSRLADGLFHQYVTQSGNALYDSMNIPREIYTNRTFHLAEYFGCPTNSSELLVNCLRMLNSSALVDTNTLFYEWKDYPLVIWGPTIEPDIEGALLTDTPANLYAAGKIRDLPWITSLTRDEGLMFAIPLYEDPNLFEEFLEKIDTVLPIILEYQYTVDNVTARTSALKSYYLNDLTANRSVLFENVTKLFGDASFIFPTYNGFQQQLKFAKSPQYLCSFEYKGTFTYTYFQSGGSTKYKGITHADEVVYLFKTYDTRLGPAGYENTDTDWKMVDTMVQLWTSFAINGTPTAADHSDVIWEPFNSANNYLRIGNYSDTSLEMKYNYLEERMQFWKELTAAPSSAFRHYLQVLSIPFLLFTISA